MDPTSAAFAIVRAAFADGTFWQDVDGTLWGWEEDHRMTTREQVLAQLQAARGALGQELDSLRAALADAHDNVASLSERESDLSAFAADLDQAVDLIARTPPLPAPALPVIS